MIPVVYLFIYLPAFWTQACPEGMCTNGLRSHARCHPYPIPQPVKVGHTTGLYDPYSFRIVVWVPLHPTRTNQRKCCETGLSVFRPYPRTLESLTICRCRHKGSAFFSVIKRPWVLVRPWFEPATSRSADRSSPNWANQAVVVGALGTVKKRMVENIKKVSERATVTEIQKICMLGSARILWRCLVYEQNDWLEWLMLEVHGLRPADAQKEHQQRLWQKR